uniref:Uncharacterized protein n=1 Tax=Echinococcus granulosus TaxID=6210 RepID=U6FVH4_ECHGR|nr:hypothetical protein EgrG_002066200 [Echinococcus granulosus]
MPHHALMDDSEDYEAVERLLHGNESSHHLNWFFYITLAQAVHHNHYLRSRQSGTRLPLSTPTIYDYGIPENDSLANTELHFRSEGNRYPPISSTCMTSVNIDGSDLAEGEGGSVTSSSHPSYSHLPLTPFHNNRQCSSSTHRINFGVKVITGVISASKPSYHHRPRMSHLPHADP